MAVLKMLEFLRRPEVRALGKAGAAFAPLPALNSSCRLPRQEWGATGMKNPCVINVSCLLLLFFNRPIVDAPTSKYKSIITLSLSLQSITENLHFLLVRG
jgi:hypothetical protein